MRKQIPTCPKCGSPDVTAMAKVYWQDGEWKANEPHEGFNCINCEVDEGDGTIDHLDWIDETPEGRL